MNNNKLMGFVKNFSLVMAGNIFSMLVSVIVTFLVPHYFSKEAYSYFQLENLYCGYIWILSLGWNDGLYIKFGGAERGELDKSKISSQFTALALYLVLSGIVLAIIFLSKMELPEKRFVLSMALISVIMEIVTISVKNLLQATNSMRQYARITIYDRSCYILFVFLLLFTKKTDFHFLLTADILSKGITLCLALYTGKDFLFAKIQDIGQIWKDTKEIISIGISISLASYSSRMINNIMQLAIENVWGLIAFGKVSLTLSISNMFTKFVAAVSVVLFPTLRRTGEKHRIDVYQVLSNILVTLMLGMFSLYLPMKYLLGIWLPDYKDSLQYMAILLPISLFETKVTMLVNTYLKIIRKEREILYCNLVTVGLSLLLAFIGAFWVHNLTLTVGMIVVLLFFRCFLEEYRLGKYIAIPISNVGEVVLCAVFIFVSWRIDGILGTGLYICSYLLFLFFYRHKIQQSFLYIKNLAKLEKRIDIQGGQNE